MTLRFLPRPSRCLSSLLERGLTVDSLDELVKEVGGVPSCVLDSLQFDLRDAIVVVATHGQRHDSAGRRRQGNARHNRLGVHGSTLVPTERDQARQGRRSTDHCVDRDQSRCALRSEEGREVDAHDAGGCSDERRNDPIDDAFPHGGVAYLDPGRRDRSHFNLMATTGHSRRGKRRHASSAASPDGAPHLPHATSTARRSRTSRRYRLTCHPVGSARALSSAWPRRYTGRSFCVAVAHTTEGLAPRRVGDRVNRYRFEGSSPSRRPSGQFRPHHLARLVGIDSGRREIERVASF